MTQWLVAVGLAVGSIVQSTPINNQKVAIEGKVDNPGGYALYEPTSVLQLVERAGLEPDATEIYVWRRRDAPDGSLVVRTFKYPLRFKGMALPPQLEPGDQVVVK